MSVLSWAVGELQSYGILCWLPLIAIAFLASRYGGIAGIVGGHLLVGFVVMVLDGLWIQSEMRTPG